MVQYNSDLWFIGCKYSPAAVNAADPSVQYQLFLAAADPKTKPSKPLAFYYTSSTVGLIHPTQLRVGMKVEAEWEIRAYGRVLLKIQLAGLQQKAPAMPQHQPQQKAPATPQHQTTIHGILTKVDNLPNTISVQNNAPPGARALLSVEDDTNNVWKLWLVSTSVMDVTGTDTIKIGDLVSLKVLLPAKEILHMVKPSQHQSAETDPKDWVNHCTQGMMYVCGVKTNKERKTCHFFVPSTSRRGDCCHHRPHTGHVCDSVIAQTHLAEHGKAEEYSVSWEEKGEMTVPNEGWDEIMIPTKAGTK